MHKASMKLYYVNMLQSHALLRRGFGTSVPFMCAGLFVTPNRAHTHCKVNFNHLLPSCEDTVGPVLIVSFNYCVCLFLATLQI